ncbi:MAG: chemotaxis protein CheW [Planctomycetes bacterium]|nr:chemotaxis protein CheW [Planctomycetota bacterium]
MAEQDDIMQEFLVETNEGLDQLDRDLVALEQDPGSPAIVAQIFRTMHTIKGSSGFLSLDKLGRVAHLAESLLTLLRDGRRDADEAVTTALLASADAIRSIVAHVEHDGNEGDDDHAAVLEALSRLVEGGPRGGGKTDPAGEPAPAREPQSGATNGGANTLRVDVGLLDTLMNLVGELVLARNQILQVSGQLGDTSLVGTCQRLNLVTSELQEGVMKTRMQAIGTVWTKFPRVVRDLAVSCGKQVRLEMDGHATELDKTILESVKDPLVHAIRNAVDHGIEPPGPRRDAGKPAEGTLRLRAWHEGGQVNIEVSDDGRGIDPAAVRRKAIASGLLTAERAAAMTERDLVQMIMMPGFSTAERVTSVSGRGVGMDVVKTNIERIGGTLEVHSVIGEGTTLRIRIPLTLAIIPALIVTSAGDRFAIPQVNLLELVRLEHPAQGIEHIDGAPVHRLRGDLLPLVHLDELLGQRTVTDPDATTETNIVVLQADGQQFGLVVTSILDTEEIVVKPLSKQLQGLQAFAGAAIMGDGRVALILDVPGLARSSGLLGEGRQRRAGAVDAAAGPEAATASWLLVRLGGGRRVAIDLAAVARLEEQRADQVERADGREVLQYRGQIMPLVCLDARLEGRRAAAATPAGEDSEPLQVVVVRDRAGRTAGLSVHRILDIFDEPVATLARTSSPLLRGAAALQGRVTDVLDVEAVVCAELGAVAQGEHR